MSTPKFKHNNLLFRAFQIPGWVNEINPTIITLKRALRYHLVMRDTGFCTGWSVLCSGSESAWTATCECPILCDAIFNGRHFQIDGNCFYIYANFGVSPLNYLAGLQPSRVLRWWFMSPSNHAIRAPIGRKSCYSCVAKLLAWIWRARRKLDIEVDVENALGIWRD